jgi:hypothetical protein
VASAKSARQDNFAELHHALGRGDIIGRRSSRQLAIYLSPPATSFEKSHVTTRKQESENRSWHAVDRDVHSTILSEPETLTTNEQMNPCLTLMPMIELR